MSPSWVELEPRWMKEGRGYIEKVIAIEGKREIVMECCFWKFRVIFRTVSFADVSAIGEDTRWLTSSSRLGRYDRNEREVEGEVFSYRETCKDRYRLECYLHLEMPLGQ